MLGAFFDPAALARMVACGRVRSRPRGRSGIYAIEWNPTPEADAILGRLGGVFYGMVDGVQGRARTVRRRRVVDSA